MKNLIKTLFLLFIAVSVGCKKQEDNDNQNGNQNNPYDESYTEINYSIAGLSVGDEYINFHQTGTLSNSQLKENSGLAVSSYNPSWIFGHNDGGDYNRIFLMDTTGKHLANIVVYGAGNRDSEDMCIDANPIDGKRYIFWGDIGDNSGVYPQIYVYRFPEPNFNGQPKDTTLTEEVMKLTFTYPDGPRDAEALLVDPITHNLYIITKRDVKGQIYRAKYPFDDTKPNQLQMIGKLPFSGVVGGDISDDGKHIALKTYSNIYHWHRNTDSSFLNALKTPPTRLPYIAEDQGEAVAWSSGGERYFTAGEGTNVGVFSGQRKN